MAAAPAPPEVTLVLADSAVEIVPRSLREHPSILSTAARTGSPPDRTLLDSSFHHRAMRRLPDAEKRGRPDILHLCALLALGSRASRAGRLRLLVHTYGGEVISISPATRLPRVYDRFKGLMAQLLVDGAVPKDDPLLVVEGVELKDALRDLAPDRVVALTSTGTRTQWGELLPPGQPPPPTAFLLGGFPRGPFREATDRLASHRVSVADEPLEAWTAESELLAHLALAYGLV